MEAQQLASLIYARIKSDGPMSLPDILERAKSKGHDTTLVLAAVSRLGRFVDIKVTVKDTGDMQGGTAYYSIKAPSTPRTVSAPRRPSPEESARMDAEVRDYWEHSPFVSDCERECYHASMTDKSRWKTCECEACVQWRWMLMTREERGMVEITRQREVMKMI